MNEHDKREILDAIESARDSISKVGHTQAQKTRELIRREFAALNQRLEQIEQKENQIMGQLDTEFANLDAKFTELGAAIDREFQQVLDSIAAGNDAKATVEDARSRVTALTDVMSAQIAKLASDDPAPPTP